MGGFSVDCLPCVFSIWQCGIRKTGLSIVHKQLQSASLRSQTAVSISFVRLKVMLKWTCKFHPSSPFGVLLHSQIAKWLQKLGVKTSILVCCWISVKACTTQLQLQILFLNYRPCSWQILLFAVATTVALAVWTKIKFQWFGNVSAPCSLFGGTLIFQFCIMFSV